MHEGGHVDSATLRGARIVGVVCAVAFFAPIVLSLVFLAHSADNPLIAGIGRRTLRAVLD